MTKFRQAYEEMVVSHQKEFDEFREIHDKFAKDNDKYKAEFDRIGKPVIRIIQEKENWLCGKMEGGGYGKYSDKLADKFRQEVKKSFPLYELVGVEIS